MTFKDLLDSLKSRSFSQVSSITNFDFSTLYTTLSHDKLKIRLQETIHKAFSLRNYGSKCVGLGYINSTYFSNKIQKGKTCYSEEQVISMLEFLNDNIFVSFGGTVSAGRRHTNGYELCPSSNRFIFILI